MKTPVLETTRLKLRAHTKDDFLASFAMWSHVDVVRFIGGEPSTEAQAWSRLMNYRGHWDLMGFGYWAVEEKSTGRYIGDVGFADFKRDMTPPLQGVPELGWVLAPAVHGQGYATEAVSAALAWGDQNLPSVAGQHRTVCIIDPANTASLKVAAKTGFKEYARGTLMGDTVLLFERDR